MPRLGFAWQPTDRFVVRGGYGATSFFEDNSSNQRLTSVTPFIQAVNVTAITPTPGNPGDPRDAEQGFTGGSVAYGICSFLCGIRSSKHAVPIDADSV